MTGGGTLRIRIIKIPTERYLEDCDVSDLTVGSTYDLGPRFAELLIVSGYAEPEMRRVHVATAPEHDRRCRHR
jgi:hypothetical protein